MYDKHPWKNKLQDRRKFPILGCPLLDGRQQAPV